MRSLALLAMTCVLQAADRPAPKQVIAALLANGDIPLSVHASCKGVGSSPGDATLRDYVSGLIENFTDEKARNSVIVRIEPAGSKGWQCQVLFVHIPGEDPFRYGVSFLLTPSRKLLRSSVRCVGAG